MRIDIMMDIEYMLIKLWNNSLELVKENNINYSYEKTYHFQIQQIIIYYEGKLCLCYPNNV